jgi:multiple antibiotic resistance protein
VVFNIEIFTYLFLVIGTLIPIASPFSTASIFLSLTTNFSKKERKQTAKLCCFYMFLLLTAFLIVSKFLLSILGISPNSVVIASGLIISYLGFGMLFLAKKNSLSAIKRANTPNDISFIPLAIPVLATPASISVVIALAAQAGQLNSTAETLLSYFSIACGIAISALICWLVLRAPSKVTRLLGRGGVDIATKLMGLLLLIIGIDFIAKGASTLF